MKAVQRNYGSIAHKASRFAEYPRKRVKDLDRWYKPVDEVAISFSIFFEGLLLVMKQLEDGIG